MWIQNRIKSYICYAFGSIITAIGFYTFFIFSITQQLISMIVMLAGISTLSIAQEYHRK